MRNQKAQKWILCHALVVHSWLFAIDIVVDIVDIDVIVDIVAIACSIDVFAIVNIVGIVDIGVNIAVDIVDIV